MVLQRSELVEVEVLNLVFRVLVALVQLDVGDRVWVADGRRRSRVQICITLLQLLELLKLFLCRQREHVDY